MIKTVDQGAMAVLPGIHFARILAHLFAYVLCRLCCHSGHNGEAVLTFARTRAGYAESSTKRAYCVKAQPKTYYRLSARTLRGLRFIGCGEQDRDLGELQQRLMRWISTAAGMTAGPGQFRWRLRDRNHVSRFSKLIQGLTFTAGHHWRTRFTFTN